MKPREFWINEYTGSASAAEESISKGYTLHVIEYDAYNQLVYELDKSRQDHVKIIQDLNTKVRELEEKQKEMQEQIDNFALAIQSYCLDREAAHDFPGTGMNYAKHYEKFKRLLESYKQGR